MDIQYNVSISPETASISLTKSGVRPFLIISNPNKKVGSVKSGPPPFDLTIQQSLSFLDVTTVSSFFTVLASINKQSLSNLPNDVLELNTGNTKISLIACNQTDWFDDNAINDSGLSQFSVAVMKRYAICFNFTDDMILNGDQLTAAFTQLSLVITPCNISQAGCSNPFNSTYMPSVIVGFVEPTVNNEDKENPCTTYLLTISLS